MANPFIRFTASSEGQETVKSAYYLPFCLINFAKKYNYEI